VQTKAEWLAEIDTTFLKKAAQLNKDRSLMSPLSMLDQLKLYGYTMQAFYGDNTT
jgi:hypothetical protein